MTIFHIAHADEWAEAVIRDDYRISSRGMTLDDVGYIHCSHAAQVDMVANSFYFDDEKPLVLLHIDESLVPDLRVEDGFPHVYGPISPEWVTEVQPVSFIDGTFRR